MNNYIRNFTIIAHIDHGKSTLADRFLELTNTVAPREMKDQYLDSLELERERGITIKMAPVRMIYRPALSSPVSLDGEDKPLTSTLDNTSGRHRTQNDYLLNLIDTPGHSDFSYEVSRALRAVEGAVLLVDATQGIQAQTLANLEAAEQAGLKVIGAINKIDLQPAGLEELRLELSRLLGVRTEEIYLVSAKTGEGVRDLLEGVIRLVPPPQSVDYQAALIFGSHYDNHKGIIAFVRVFGGRFQAETIGKLQAAKREFKIKEVGYFAPQFQPSDFLTAGEIGYLVTGIKEPDAIWIGDTVGEKALTAFTLPLPVVFVSLYPAAADDYENLKTALQRLRLNDSALHFAPDFSEVLGRGFKCGFLGKLHFEITMERLEREFYLPTVNSFPSVAYRVLTRGKEATISNPSEFPDDFEKIWEPIVDLKIITPQRFLGAVLELSRFFRLRQIRTETIADRAIIKAQLPLADLILDFDEQLKSASRGFASFSYQLAGYAEAKVRRLDILVAGERLAGLSRIVPEADLYREGKKMVTRLKQLLPRQQFVQSLQAAAGNKIIARENIPALKKNVTGHLYGGDRTRKMKLWRKQKLGKEKLQARSRVVIPGDVFRALLKKEKG